MTPIVPIRINIMFKNIIFAGPLLVSFVTAYAQSSAPFGIAGTVTPGPCSVTMSSGSNASLGSVSTSAIRGWGQGTDTSTNAIYQSQLINLPFSITCSAATKIGIALTDNNPGKITAQNTKDPVRFGLVNGGGTSSIGSFSFLFGGVLMDGLTPAKYLSALNGSTTWSSTSAAGTPAPANTAAPGSMNSFAKTAAATTPDAFTTLNGNLVISVNLGKAIFDAATTAITPTGSGTLTLVYL